MRNAFAEFFQTEALGGIVLVLCVIVAVIWANSAQAQSYFEIWNSRGTLSFGEFRIDKPILLWINDGLMAVFFLVVGLEIKRELLVGELSDARHAALPIAAAIGGMAVPAAIYIAFNAGGPGARGWGVPMATDIAFSLGVLALLGSRIPTGLKVFLAALAIVDDIGAVLVIAVFYTSKIDGAMLGWAGMIYALLLAANRAGIRWLVLYLALGFLLWFFFLKSGVHATIAGVLLALAIPTRVKIDAATFQEEVGENLNAMGPAEEGGIMSDGQQDAVRAIEQATDGVQMPLERLKHALHPWQTYGIVPLFALANAGIPLKSDTASQISSPIPLGIILGLFVGKPVGILLFSWLAVRFKKASLPESVHWGQIIGAAILAGIGFTMSLFVADLAFIGQPVHDTAKLGILIGSLAAAVVGYVWLRVCCPHHDSNIA